MVHCNKELRPPKIANIFIIFNQQEKLDFVAYQLQSTLSSSKPFLQRTFPRLIALSQDLPL